MEKDFLVLPQKKVLDGRGYVWEYILTEHGWNELNCLDQVGVVVQVWKLVEHGNSVVVDVYWPALDLTLTNLFPSELVIEEGFYDGRG